MVKAGVFCCCLEFPFQFWEISSLQQTVPAAVVRRCLLVHPLFLQHLVFYCRFVFSKYALYDCHCFYKSKLVNRSHWIIGFFSSIFAEKTIWSFCTIQAVTSRSQIKYCYCNPTVTPTPFLPNFATHFERKPVLSRLQTHTHTHIYITYIYNIIYLSIYLSISLSIYTFINIYIYIYIYIYIVF